MSPGTELRGRGQLPRTEAFLRLLAGEVLHIPPAAALKAMPAHTMRVRLVAVGEAGEAPLGEYTFVHTPS